MAQVRADVRVRDPKAARPGHAIEPLAVAFDNSVEDNDALVARVDEIVGELREEGVLTELSMKWYDQDLTTPAE